MSYVGGFCRRASHIVGICRSLHFFVAFLSGSEVWYGLPCGKALNAVKEEGTTPDRDDKQWETAVRARLQARGKERPGLKARQVLALWPDIRAAPAGGQTLRTVRDWLDEEGLAVTYGALTSYVSRIRRKEKVLSDVCPRGASGADLPGVRDSADHRAARPAVITDGNQQVDPLRNVRDRNANRPGFDYPPGVDEESLI